MPAVRNCPTIISLLALSLCALLASAWVYLDMQAEYASWQRADGEVVKMLRRRGGKAPVFSFPAADGRTYTVKSKIRSTIPAFHEGERVEVLYPAQAPAKAKINSFLELHFFSAVLAGAALVFGALAGQYWRAGRRRPQR